jgi:hypothetical protein
MKEQATKKDSSNDPVTHISFPVTGHQQASACNECTVIWYPDYNYTPMLDRLV